MTLKPLTTEDYEAYFSLRLESLRTCPRMFATDAGDWQNAPKAVIEEHLKASESAQAPMLGAWLDDELIALSILKPETRRAVRHKASVLGFYVKPEYRRQGVGQKLLEFTIATARDSGHLKQLRAVVNTSGEAALCLFERCGFERYGLEPRAKFLDGAYSDQSYLWLALDES